MNYFCELEHFALWFFPSYKGIAQKSRPTHMEAATKLPDDAELIRLAVAGDADAFTGLVERHYMRVYKMSVRACGNPSDAEDITQDVFIKLGHAIQGFRGDAAFTTWLYRIVLNTARDYVKKVKPTVALVDDDQISADGGIEEQVAHKQKLAWLHAIPDSMRDAVLLVFGEGLSHAEAAKILQCAETTISWRIFQARKVLKKKAAGE